MSIKKIRDSGPKIRDLRVVFRNPEFRDGKMSEHSGSVGNPKSVFGTPLIVWTNGIFHMQRMRNACQQCIEKSISISSFAEANTEKRMASDRMIDHAGSNGSLNDQSLLSLIGDVLIPTRRGEDCNDYIEV